MSVESDVNDCDLWPYIAKSISGVSIEHQRENNLLVSLIVSLLISANSLYAVFFVLFSMLRKKARTRLLLMSDLGCM